MIKVDFKLNKKLEILVDEKYFNSNVQDVTEDYIAISIPTNSGEYLPLSNGSIINVIYYEKENIYKFSSSIIGRKFENIPILLLAKPDDIKKIQRRRYVRVQLIKTAKYINLKYEPKVNLSAIDNSKYLKAVLVDLSGGGMRVKVSERIKDNDFLLVALTVNEEEVLIVGQTKRIMKDDDGRFICGLSFESLDNATREQLIRYIFQLMRNQMKKI
ncbi:flagellar brake domain-containing protein [Clostridium estertheticum]|uniref:flagellar brake protein n=1 Tax=Clostridium estertheticum TaxID=238834 RepID=UPI001CF46B29|nr:flagellar brake domain-containing protein [Clostridium estertheticum]MCB2308763.1 flagellar brake domain-containing protein [Clostridium estertheticum]MCB2347159.1 flagellar brake domain-containing protein [Clostridium estertheticum]MCB2351749.1 flagellar brake domain-containing protein [Clostridium estertheticum]WAG44527.1 flagellar brake domain-containing protein [Clostridium estertheticum]